VLSNRASSSVIQPAPGSIYHEGDAVTLEAAVSNFSDAAAVSEVAFYNDADELIGTDTNGSDGWSYTWQNLQPGSYNVTSVATAPDGKIGVSMPLNFRVNAPADRVISLNFAGTGSAMNPVDTAGAVSATNWNTTVQNDTTSALITGAGTATEATVFNDICCAYQSFDTETNADFKMMKGYIASFDGDTNQVVVSGLPASFVRSGYDVYVYWGNKDTDNDAVAYTIGDTTYFIRDNNEKWNGTHSRSKAQTLAGAKSGSNFVVFRNLTEASFTLLINSYNTFRGGISGLQIVAHKPKGTVSIVSPSAVSVFTECDAVMLEAQPENFAAAVTKVAFYSEDNGLIGEDTDGSNGWKVTWSRPVPGAYTITATASDETGFEATSEPVQINVAADTTVPVISVAAAPKVLWPPNHMYRTLNVADIVNSVTDPCPGPLAVADVRILRVTSDEAEIIPGNDNTRNDMVIAADCRSVQLRAERNELADGRVYTIELAVKDLRGNEAEALYQVHVPVEYKGVVINNGSVYTVESSCTTAAGVAARQSFSGEPLSNNRSIEISPNPASDRFTIRYTAATTGTVQVILSDMLARPVQLQTEAVQAGVNQIRVEVPQLKNGLYLVTIVEGNRKVVQKVIITR
jgi:hypothetical protein